VGFFQNKICPFLAQGICIYVGHFFYVKNVSQEKRNEDSPIL
jgi:hypothetical protein